MIYLRGLAEHHKVTWKERDYYSSVIIGAVFLAISFFFNFQASVYATNSASLPVTDLILSNLRVYDVDGALILVSLALFIFTLIQIVRKPQLLPFMLKSWAVFILVRASFITLTHIGPFTPHLEFGFKWALPWLGLSGFDDLFFSGHTGLPFMFSLIFWGNKKIRTIYLAASIVLGILVLLGHLHYSIDVFAAFFITYTIFHICKWLFPKDWRRVESSIKGL